MDLQRRLKQIIIEALHLEDLTIDDIDDDAPLFGDGLGLDSIDALELALEVERHFDVQIEDNEASRQILASVSALARYIQEQQAA